MVLSTKGPHTIGGCQSVDAAQQICKLDTPPPQCAHWGTSPIVGEAKSTSFEVLFSYNSSFRRVSPVLGDRYASGTSSTVFAPV